jgi:hypothetical protein
MRKAKGQLTARQIAEHAMRAKWLDTDDAKHRAVIIEQIRIASYRIRNVAVDKSQPTLFIALAILRIVEVWLSA